MRETKLMQTLHEWGLNGVDGVLGNPVCMAAYEAISQLRNVLEPFARAAEDLDDDHEDRGDIWESAAALEITAGHLRLAQILLADE